MTQRTPRYTRLLIVLGLGVAALEMTGCGQPANATEGDDTLPDYQQRVDDSHHAATEALKMYEVAGSNLRLEVARLKAEMGLDAIDALLEFETLSPKQRANLHKQKADLLLIGKRAGAEGFEAELLAFAEQIRDVDPGGEVAAYLYIKSYDDRYRDHVDAAEAMEALDLYVQNFGPDEQARTRFLKLATQLTQHQRFGQALACYETARRHYPQDDAFITASGRIEQYYASWMQATQQQQLARRALKSKLGNQEHATFLIAVWQDEQGDGLGELSYSVCTNLDGVRKTINQLKAGSFWKMMRAFPNSPEGREQAGATRKKLQRTKSTCWDYKLQSQFQSLEELAWAND
ncbi:MAG: hypothetical protein AAGF97_10300 [Planctomycetota bacterium]